MVDYNTVIMLCLVSGAVCFILGYFVCERHSVIVTRMLRIMIAEHVRAEFELIEKGNKLSNSSVETKDV